MDFKHNMWSFSMFNKLWIEVIVGFIDNGGIHYLNFLFMKF